ncbi:MAG TPA: hypothetical protein VEJ23_05915 [Solirubrobacteraceae bacterium]|nr:hypothetical protein [Solirubrobacteraceae bacterium]
MLWAIDVDAKGACTHSSLGGRQAAGVRLRAAYARPANAGPAWRALRYLVILVILAIPRCVWALPVLGFDEGDLDVDPGLGGDRVLLVGAASGQMPEPLVGSIEQVVHGAGGDVQDASISPRSPASPAAKQHGPVAASSGAQSALASSRA